MLIMSTKSAKEMDENLGQKKNRKERNKEKLETSTKIQQPCTKCSESFSSKKKLMNHMNNMHQSCTLCTESFPRKKELIKHMINVHDLLRSQAERVAGVSSEIIPSREKFNHHEKKIHEDSKSDKDTDHIDRSMGIKVALANEKSHVEDHRFATNQNLPYRNQNSQRPQHQTKQRFDPWIRDPDPHNNGSQSQWRPRPAFSSQSRFASPQNSWNSNWKANWNNPNNPAYRQNFNSRQVSTRHVGLV